ncbi:minor capsid protein [Bacillus swezeyi]|uniref:minor capsid protein n=1 Tax=Bacillus swezeyi TaxID=1925020 RepID=UPI002E1DB776|nr:minor capsid protein [Bacillus swezeyi]
MINFNVRMNIDWGSIERRTNRGFDASQEIVDSQVLKDSNRYIAFDTGELARSGVRSTEPGSGKVIWDMPYGRKMYYNPQFNFSKDKNPLAGGLWFERARSSHLNEWINMGQNAFNQNFRG